MSKETVGVILAGGQSRRMGTDKTFLKIRGVPLIARVLKALLPIFSTVAVVLKGPEKFHRMKDVRLDRVKNIHLVQDLFPEQHALGGIYTALTHFPGRDCFVFACDLPFLNPPLIRFMMQKRNGYEVFIPKSCRGLEPLHALFTEACLNVMEDQIHQKRWALAHFIRKVHFGILDPEILHAFDPEELSLLNVNTLEDFRKAKAIEQNRSMSLTRDLR